MAVAGAAADAALAVSAVRVGQRRAFVLSPLALGVASGLLCGAGFRCAGAAPTVFIALVPLLFAARLGMRAAALAGVLTGMVGYTVVLGGLPETLVRFYAIPVQFAWLIFVLGVAYHALQVVLFTAGAAAVVVPKYRVRAAPECARHALLVAVELAALWVMLEWAYPKVFPWSLGGALAAQPLFRQSADLGGVYGLGFAAVVVNAVVVAALTAPRRSATRRWALGAACSVIAGLALYGAWRIGSTGSGGKEGTRQVEVAVVQAALPAEQAYAESTALQAWTTYERLTNGLFASASGHDSAPPDVIIWPESTLPVYLRHDDWYRERVERLVAQRNRPLILGALDRSDAPVREFNSAYAFLPSNTRRAHIAGSNSLQVYHKSSLVPWAEYIPAGRWLPFLRQWRTTGDFAAGTERESFSLDRSDDDPAPLRIAPSICIEALQPGWFNSMVRAGANLLVNITDDGWYAGSAAPDVHLQLSRLRAVETRRWLVRASNSGISAIIDPSGEIVASLPFGAVGTLTHAVDLSERMTPYVYFGDWVVWLSVIIVAVTLARRLQPAREQVGGPIAGGALVRTDLATLGADAVPRNETI